MIIVGILCILTVPAVSQGVGPSGSRDTGVVERPCPPLPGTSGITDARIASLLEPGAALPVLSAERRAALQRANEERLQNDWAQLCRYQADNQALGAPPDGETRVVFLGDSITEFWTLGDPGLFDEGVIGRGISGQTTAQMLLRFRQDVIDLHPAAVHLMAGTNDIAGNGGPTTLTMIQANIQSMIDLAEQHGITVVLASVPPAAEFGWRPGLEPAQTIAELNTWLKGYAAGKGLCFVDYHSVLTDSNLGLRTELANDGVHPNRSGYALMKPLAEAAITTARSNVGRNAKRCPTSAR